MRRHLIPHKKFTKFNALIPKIIMQHYISHNSFGTHTSFFTGRNYTESRLQTQIY